MRRYQWRVRCRLVGPLRHWSTVPVKLLSKVLGLLGFLVAVVRAKPPLSFDPTIFTIDLMWWVPFTLNLLRSYQAGPAKGVST